MGAALPSERGGTKGGAQQAPRPGNGATTGSQHPTQSRAQQQDPQPIPTIDGEVDPGPVLEVGVVAGSVEEEHAALVPALVLSAQQVDAQRRAFLDPHATCRTSSTWHCLGTAVCVPQSHLPPPPSELLTLGSPAKPRSPPHSSSLPC